MKLFLSLAYYVIVEATDGGQVKGKLSLHQ